MFRCEKLRRKANSFALPGLIEALIDLLQSSLESYEKGSKEEIIVTDLIQQLTINNSPLVFGDDKEKRQRPPKMSVTNLLS
jgi:hypothetical protein